MANGKPANASAPTDTVFSGTGRQAQTGADTPEREALLTECAEERRWKFQPSAGSGRKQCAVRCGHHKMMPSGAVLLNDSITRSWDKTELWCVCAGSHQPWREQMDSPPTIRNI